MLNLIKNEIYKIFHKKSTYIVLIITALFITLVSYIISHDKIYTYMSSDMIYEVDSDDATLNKVNKEINELYKDYNEDTWQYFVMDKVYEIITGYYYAKESNTLDNTILNNYNNAIKALKEDNWKYFVNLDINYYKEELKLNEEALKVAKSDKQKKEIEAQIFTLKESIKVNEYRLNEDLKYGSNYLNNAINTVLYSADSVKKYELADEKEEKAELESSVKEYHEAWYILDNKEDINNTSDLRYLLTNFYTEYIFLILVFGVMIAGSSVSEEINKGTIKSLLITPYKRRTILLSKFITSICLTVLFIIICYILQIIIGGIFFGFSSLSNKVVEYNLVKGSIEVVSLFKYMVIYTLANLPLILLLITLAFSISAIVGNTALSIVVAFAGVIGSTIINSFALIYKIDILKYFVTTNWDFNYYLFGGTSPYNTSLTHAIVVCIIYFIIMIVTTFIIFTRKNIKNI